MDTSSACCGVVYCITEFMSIETGLDPAFILAQERSIQDHELKEKKHNMDPHSVDFIVEEILMYPDLNTDKNYVQQKIQQLEIGHSVIFPLVSGELIVRRESFYSHYIETRDVLPKKIFGNDAYTLIGIGGEHIIFSHVEHPDIVIKVNYWLSKDTIHTVTEKDHHLEQLELSLKALVQQQQDVITELKKVFGKESVPSQHWFVGNVPVTLEQIKYIYKDEPIPDTLHSVSELPVIMNLQKKITRLDTQTHISLDALVQYKGHELTPEEHTAFISKYVLHPHGGKAYIDDKTVYKAFPKIETFLQQVEHNHSLLHTVQTFVRNAIRFSHNGKILDIGGKDNIVFIEEDETWKTTLVDPSPSSAVQYEQFRKTMDAFLQNNDLSQEEQETLFRFTNYTQTLNMLAEQLGISERIELLATDKTEAPVASSLSGIINKYYAE